MIERVIERRPFRDIEPYIQRDAAQKVRDHKRSYHSGIEGKAKNYLMVGPWIKLRLLKQTIHITMKGRPPLRAFEILAKHFMKQLKISQNPRILLPQRTKRETKHMLTVATTERLKNINQFELVTLLQKSLRKKLHHIIYRQNNVGGPLFKFAKTNDTLY
jgi:hypothetical protein